MMQKPADKFGRKLQLLANGIDMENGVRICLVVIYHSPWNHSKKTRRKQTRSLHAILEEEEETNEHIILIR